MPHSHEVVFHGIEVRLTHSQLCVWSSKAERGEEDHAVLLPSSSYGLAMTAWLASRCGSESRRPAPDDVQAMLVRCGFEVAGSQSGGDGPLTRFAWADKRDPTFIGDELDAQTDAADLNWI